MPSRDPEYGRKYYASHKEACRTYSKARYRSDPRRHYALTREWLKKHPEKAKLYNKIKRLKVYSLTFEEHDALVITQDGRCAICKMVPKVLVVDHSHVTGRVRGLLCHSCNMALGHVEKVLGWCDEATQYLEKTQTTHKALDRRI